MADYGNQGTSPFDKIVLGIGVAAGTDTPYPLSFLGDSNTGLYRKAAATLGVGAGGIEQASIISTGITFTGYFNQSSIATGLTATTGSVAGARQLAAVWNFIGTAGANSGVILPLAATVGVGGMVHVFNDGASAIKVYGAGSDTVDGNAAAVGVTLTNAKRAMFLAKTTTSWISAQWGVVSA